MLLAAKGRTKKNYVIVFLYFCFEVVTSEALVIYNCFDAFSIKLNN